MAIWQERGGGGGCRVKETCAKNKQVNPKYYDIRFRPFAHSQLRLIVQQTAICLVALNSSDCWSIYWMLDWAQNDPKKETTTNKSIHGSYRAAILPFIQCIHFQFQFQLQYSKLMRATFIGGSCTNYNMRTAIRLRWCVVYEYIVIVKPRCMYAHFAYSTHMQEWWLFRGV